MSRFQQDQAAGLRRLFTAHEQHLVPVVANPFDNSCGSVMQHLAQTVNARHGHVLVIDVADGAPEATAALSLEESIESLSPQVSYFAGAGLPQRWAQRHGTAAGLVDGLAQACPQADVLLLHANAQDLPRLCRGRRLTPLLLASDHPASVQHAYAALKGLTQRCGWTVFDLLLAAEAHAPRSQSILNTLRVCLQRFGINATLRHSQVFDPDEPLSQSPAAEWLRLVGYHMGAHSDERVQATDSWAAPTGPSPAAASFNSAMSAS